MDFVASPFHEERFLTVQEAWQKALNEHYWTHGITISQGNEWSVTKEACVRRLNYIRMRLAREMFGNHWREKSKIVFLVFKHGSPKRFDQHFHALVAIEGLHDWSHFRIGLTIKDIEKSRGRARWEKLADVEWDWRSGNRFHAYCSRYAHANTSDSDNWFFV